jgi:hypothetical protein
MSCGMASSEDVDARREGSCGRRDRGRDRVEDVKSVGIRRC